MILNVYGKFKEKMAPIEQISTQREPQRVLY